MRVGMSPSSENTFGKNHWVVGERAREVVLGAVSVDEFTKVDRLIPRSRVGPCV